MMIRRAILPLLLVAVLPAVALAQDQKIHESYRAFGVAMGAGASGVLDITITRWTTEDERKMLVEYLVENGQEKTVELLRKQKETGFVRTQSGAGMRGWPSVRLHYAYQFPQPDGKRLIILVTDRNISGTEATSGGRSLDYDISAIVMELEKGQDGKEKGKGSLYLATKLTYDKEKKKMEVEYMGSGSQPIQLTDIKREK